MKIFNTKNTAFRRELFERIKRDTERERAVLERVKRIIEDVRNHGDSAILRLTREIDGIEMKENELIVKDEEILNARRRISDEQFAALKLAKERIEKFHSRRSFLSWFNDCEDGIVLGQIVRPLKRVGIYVPGGKASYPSTVLMNAVPANIAGVSEIYMATPPSSEGINPAVLVAAELAGVKRIFRIGGAQAIAAFAYGTATVPRVDKIVGPGNIYVETAKRLVFGDVGIDMIAGPSEILILTDGSIPARYIASDLLSQAEHDEDALAGVITIDEDITSLILDEIRLQISTLPRAAIANKSLESRGFILIASNIDEALEIVNEIAPEHLELAVKDPWKFLPGIRNAGAVFLGSYSPEAIGDYIAGPNHTLPTGGCARFSSPLDVDDFIKRTNIISMTESSLRRMGNFAILLSGMEGLEGHGRSIMVRMEEK